MKIGLLAVVLLILAVSTAYATRSPGVPAYCENYWNDGICDDSQYYCGAAYSTASLTECKECQSVDGTSGYFNCAKWRNSGTAKKAPAISITGMATGGICYELGGTCPGCWVSCEASGCPSYNPVVVTPSTGGTFKFYDSELQDWNGDGSGDHCTYFHGCPVEQKYDSNGNPSSATCETPTDDYVRRGCSKYGTPDYYRCGTYPYPCETNAPTVTLYCPAGTNMICSSYRCTCPSGYGDCDSNPSNGCETNLLTDPNYCGRCDRSCGGQPCVNGVCQQLEGCPLLYDKRCSPTDNKWVQQCVSMNNNNIWNNYWNPKYFDCTSIQGSRTCFNNQVVTYSTPGTCENKECKKSITAVCSSTTPICESGACRRCNWDSECEQKDRSIPKCATDGQCVASVQPSISSVQGYNAANNLYALDKAFIGDYLVIWGNFPDASDTNKIYQVTIDGKLCTPVSERTNQINVQLSGTCSPSPGSVSVSVKNTKSTSGSKDLWIFAADKKCPARGIGSPQFVGCHILGIADYNTKQIAEYGCYDSGTTSQYCYQCNSEYEPNTIQPFSICQQSTAPTVNSRIEFSPPTVAPGADVRVNCIAVADGIPNGCTISPDPSVFSGCQPQQSLSTGTMNVSYCKAPSAVGTYNQAKCNTGGVADGKTCSGTGTPATLTVSYAACSTDQIRSDSDHQCKICSDSTTICQVKSGGTDYFCVKDGSGERLWKTDAQLDASCNSDDDLCANRFEYNTDCLDATGGLFRSNMIDSSGRPNTKIFCSKNSVNVTTVSPYGWRYGIPSWSTWNGQACAAATTCPSGQIRSDADGPNSPCYPCSDSATRCQIKSGGTDYFCLKDGTGIWKTKAQIDLLCDSDTDLCKTSEYNYNCIDAGGGFFRNNMVNSTGYPNTKIFCSKGSGSINVTTVSPYGWRFGIPAGSIWNGQACAATSDFTISLHGYTTTNPIIAVSQGRAAAIVIDVAPLTYGSEITFSTTSLSNGITASWTINPCTPTSSLRLGQNEIVTFTVGNSVPAGSYPITITGTSGAKASLATLTLQVSAQSACGVAGYACCSGYTCTDTTLTCDASSGKCLPSCPTAAATNGVWTGCVSAQQQPANAMQIVGTYGCRPGNCYICKSGTWNGQACVQSTCTSSQGCPATAPICSSGSCRTCNTNTECASKSSSMPVCSNGQCTSATACTSSDQCLDTAAPICSSGTCAPCTADSQCTARSSSTPVCSNGACTGQGNQNLDTFATAAGKPPITTQAHVLEVGWIRSSSILKWRPSGTSFADTPSAYTICRGASQADLTVLKVQTASGSVSCSGAALASCWIASEDSTAAQGNTYYYKYFDGSLGAAGVSCASFTVASSSVVALSPAATCSNDDGCTDASSKRCSGNVLQQCGNYDGDGCLEWPAATTGTGNTACSGTTPVCSNGACTNSAITTITSCSEITRPGRYVLSNDLYSDSKTCLNVHDVQQVFIDCQGHSINLVNPQNIDIDSERPLKIKNVNTFDLTSCKMNVLNDLKTYTFEIVNSINGNISGNTFGKYFVQAVNCSSLQIKNNSFESTYDQIRSHDMIIQNNTFNPPAFYNAAPVTSQHGYNNRIIGNTIDGKWDGIIKGADFYYTSSDDGIALDNESRIIVQNNYIKNTWDCGMDIAGLFTNSAISGNVINHTAHCGIGAWHRMSWRSNTIQDNIVDNTSVLFYIFRENNWLEPYEQYMYFENNLFKNNKLVKAFYYQGVNPALVTPSFINPINFVNQPSGSQIPIDSGKRILRNNIFMNNDFGSIYGPPVFKPGNMIVDGGGNICSRSTETDFPLLCSITNPTVSNLRITNSAASSVSLQWQSTSTGCSYNIYRARDTGSFSKLASTVNLVYTDSGVFTPGTYKYYVTCAMPDVGYESAPSNIVTWTSGQNSCLAAKQTDNTIAGCWQTGTVWIANGDVTTQYQCDSGKSCYKCNSGYTWIPNNVNALGGSCEATVPDFSLTVPANITVLNGSSYEMPIVISRTGGYSSYIILSIGGQNNLPQGTTTVFSSPTLLNGETSSSLTITVPRTAQPGTYTFNITAQGLVNSNNVQHNYSVSLKVSNSAAVRQVNVGDIFSLAEGEYVDVVGRNVRFQLRRILADCPGMISFSGQTGGCAELAWTEAGGSTQTLTIPAWMGKKAEIPNAGIQIELRDIVTGHASFEVKNLTTLKTFTDKVFYDLGERALITMNVSTTTNNFANISLEVTMPNNNRTNLTLSSGQCTTTGRTKECSYSAYFTNTSLEGMHTLVATYSPEGLFMVQASLFSVINITKARQILLLGNIGSNILQTAEYWSSAAGHVDPDLLTQDSHMYTALYKDGSLATVVMIVPYTPSSSGGIPGLTGSVTSRNVNGNTIYVLTDSNNQKTVFWLHGNTIVTILSRQLSMERFESNPVSVFIMLLGRPADVPDEIISAYIERYTSDTLIAGPNTYSLQLRKGWNMFSTPVYNNDNRHLDSFFSFDNNCTYTSKLWFYSTDQQKYERTETIWPRGGFWVKVAGNCTVNVTGDGISSNEMLFSGFDLAKGWNLVGGASSPVSFSSITGSCDVRRGPLWYDPAGGWRQADMMEAGKGYLIGVASKCSLVAGDNGPPVFPQ